MYFASSVKGYIFYMRNSLKYLMEYLLVGSESALNLGDASLKLNKKYSKILKKQARSKGNYYAQKEIAGIMKILKNYNI